VDRVGGRREFFSRASTRRRALDEAEFSEWYEECFEQAFRIARRLLGEDGAEDAAAEAFARAFASWPSIRDLPYRDAWVMRVTSNVALTTLARRPPPASAPESVDEEDAVATRLALAASLRQLPKRQREVVVLRYLAGYSERDVARALGIAASTVKTHLERGISALRGDFGPTSASDGGSP
jgi:RNA polymerase sigma-70 factor (ECF subfamily)